MNPIQELIVDAYECKANLSDVQALEKAARSAVEAVGATVVKSCHHAFQPHGLTLCLILQESHFVISTWPEFQMAVVNIFLCNPAMNAEKCWELFSKALRPGHSRSHTVPHRIEAGGKKAA